MRIAVVAPPWAPIPPPLYGGIEQVVDGLSRGFADSGHDVMLFTTGDSTCPVERRWLLERAEGERMGFTVPELRHVLAAYEAVEGFDVVHDHTLLGPLLAHDHRAPAVVTTIHGPFNEELVDLYSRMAPVPVIAISHAQRTAAPEVPIARVIHHGVEPADFPIGSGDGGYCLFLGRMFPEKGAHAAVAAARKAGVPLVLAGKCREPWERRYFENDVLPQMGPDTTFVGEVSHEEKLRLLAGARATLFPIRWNEPFGLVVIESLACGTPVLAFPEGAVPEVVEHARTGFLCRDETDMAEAIAAVDVIDRRECRAAVEGYFSRRRMVDEHLEFFSQLLDR